MDSITYYNYNLDGKSDIYLGHSLDLDADSIFPLKFELVSKTTPVQGGIKLVQQFLRTLLTDKGSDVFDPSRGTFFYKLLLGNSADLESIKNTVYESIREATSQVRYHTRRHNTSKDEVLNKVDINQLYLYDNGIVVEITLLTEEGTDIVIRVPLQWRDNEN